MWLKSEADISSSGGDADLQLLYGRLITAYFDLQAGVRLEQRLESGNRPSRFLGVLGLQGLALYNYDIDLAVFIGQGGEFSGRLTVAQDYRLTQKLISQFRLETEAALQAVDSFQVGSGLNYLSLGFRVRYEMLREIAPYIGISWRRYFGDTANFIRREGADPSQLAILAGLRLWF